MQQQISTIIKSVPWHSRPLPRVALLLLATSLVAHCALLALQYRAVPPGDCFRAGFAVLFAQLFTLRFPPQRAVDTPVRPLASSAVFRRATVRLILLTAAMLSLLLPWAIILLLDDVGEGAKVLGPHLFAFSTQLLFEIWSYRTEIAIALRVVIPVAFCTYRLRLIAEWITRTDTIARPDVAFATRGLGVANAAFWSFVLFYVLLFKVCPPYFAQAVSDLEEKEAPCK